MTDNKHAIAGIALIVLALQILSVSDTMAKYLSASLPVLLVIWGRFFFHCLITGAYVALVHDWRLLLPNVSRVQTARSLALFSAVGLFYVTIHHLPLTTALTLWFVEPFILTILAMIFFRERVSRLQWGAIIVGFLGIVIAIRPTPLAWHWTYLVGLLAGVSYAVFLLLTRAIDNRTPPIASVYQTGLVGSFASSLLVIPVWSPPSIAEWGLLLATGCVAAIAHYLIVKSFERAEASRLAPFTYSEMIGAAVLGFLVFGDLPDIWTCLGLAVVIASAIALLWGKRPAAAPAEA